MLSGCININIYQKQGEKSIMGFKKVNDYNNEKFGGLFLLRNDGDTADVIFMYRGIDDVLVADTHYIKSSDYSGYVHCCGRGCPACNRGIRVQTKLFIPLYNITEGQLQFWDRSMRFENQLQQDVFSRYPNPSEFVFRITRKGAAGDVNTTYSITAVGRNTSMSYDKILSDNDTSYPEHYEAVCRDIGAAELSAMLSTPTESDAAAMPAYSYTAVPRVSFNAQTGAAGTSAVPDMPPIPEYTDADAPEELDDNVTF